MTTFDEVLRKTGIDHRAREKIFNHLSTAKAEDKPDDSLPRASNVVDALREAGFGADATDRICRALARAGHVNDDADVMHASAAGLSPLQKQALKVAERFGVTVRARSVNMRELNQALEGRSIDERFRVKAILRAAGFID